jgi:hypothetical protein
VSAIFEGLTKMDYSDVEMQRSAPDSGCDEKAESSASRLQSLQLARHGLPCFSLAE